jgi:hypothetical protein
MKFGKYGKFICTEKHRWSAEVHHNPSLPYTILQVVKREPPAFL